MAPPDQATVETVANHVDHIAQVAGKEQSAHFILLYSQKQTLNLSEMFSVGLGSDFDGIGEVPVGLEDVSKYPALVRSSHK